MYTFELEPTSGFEQFNPVFNGADLDRLREPDNVRTRDNMGGTLLFYGSEAETLRTITDKTEILIKIKYNGVQVLSGQLNLLGEYDQRSETAKLNFIQFDQYTDILQNIDAEVTIRELQNVPILHSHNSSQNFVHSGYKLTSTQVDGEVPGFEVIPGGDTPALYSALTQYTEADIYVDPDGNYLYYGNLANVFITDATGYHYAALQDTLGNAPTTGASNDYWVILHPTDQFRLIQEVADYQFSESAQYNESKDWWYLEGTQTGTYSFQTDSIKMYDLLVLLLNEADSSINITESTYCQYFNNYTDVDYHTLYFKDFSDEPIIKLSEILNMYFVKWELDWQISAGADFTFVHPSEINLTVPLPASAYPEYHLNNYKSTNWTVCYYTNDFSEHINKETWQFGDTDNPDFTIQTISYDVSYQETKGYTTGVKTDFKSAQTSKDGQLLMHTFDVNGVISVNNRTSVITALSITNGGLATAYCVKFHHTYNRPFEDGAFLEAPITLNKKRSNEVTIKVPYTSQDVLDFDNLIRTDLADIELTQVTVKLDGSFSEVKGVF